MADVRPSDWAYQAGYANGTVAGGRPIRRFEGAALLLSGEVGAFYWTVPAPDIVNTRREEQGSVSV